MNPQFQAYPAKATQAESITIAGYCEGGNGADLTIIEGVGVTSFVRTGEGLYTVTIPRPYAALVSWHFDFAADTMSDVDAHTCRIDLDSLAKADGQTTFNIRITSDGSTAADLLVNEFLSFSFTFRDTTRKTN